MESPVARTARLDRRKQTSPQSESTQRRRASDDRAEIRTVTVLSRHPRGRHSHAQHLIVRTEPHRTRSSRTEDKDTKKKKKKREEAFTYDFERAVERARSAARRNPDVLSLQNGLDYCKEEQSGGHGRTAHAQGPSPKRREKDARGARERGAPHVTRRAGGCLAVAYDDSVDLAALAPPCSATCSHP
ncbi:hypothetical protein HPB50_020722 [Hyalomma asiaticum]|uniref:Uncharacterized protein n=1 Tax=Hyalomma asiaticum TaxID=266040 RepID=A0ACB7TN79_HYAAI|nr:hypothetical protein HPB50_020722 [Hyalomma asiaticum]